MAAVFGKGTLVALIAVISTLANAQQVATRVYGLTDTDVPTPIHSTQKVSDAGAIQAIISYVSASGISNWQGMTADGAVSFGDDPQTYPAHLSVLGDDKFRLDVQRAAGVESTVFNGPRAVFDRADGTQVVLSSDISALGLLAFPRLLTAGYPTSSTILSDQGAITIKGAFLHRITLEDPSTDDTGLPWKTCDLYFEASTGNLVESTSFGHLSSSDSALYMLEITYGNYNTVGTVTLPYSITQSLNGNRQWSLTLTTTSLSPIPDISLFQF